MNAEVSSSCLCRLGGRVRVCAHWRKLREELWEEFGDLPADGSRRVLQLIRRLPAWHHVMGVDLKSKRKTLNKHRVKAYNQLYSLRRDRERTWMKGTSDGSSFCTCSVHRSGSLRGLKSVTTAPTSHCFTKLGSVSSGSPRRRWN